MNIIKGSLSFKIFAIGAVLAVSLGAIFFSAERVALAAGATVTLSSIPGQNVTVGDTATFTASATDSDASSTIAYGLSGAPAGAAIDPAAGTFSWDTTGTNPGTYSFVVTATGSTGGSDSENVSIIVNPPAISTNGTGGTATSTGGTIDTGAANASTTVDNNLNTDNVSPDAPGKANASTITASSTNDGVLDNAATSTADTGDNTVTGGTGDNTITTGNAV